jgi:hypothetical protein
MVSLMETNQEVAATIYRQIGTSLSMALGIRNKVFTSASAQFDCQRNTRVIISYNAGTDLYDIVIGRMTTVRRLPMFVTVKDIGGCDVEVMLNVLDLLDRGAYK